MGKDRPKHYEQLRAEHPDFMNAVESLGQAAAAAGPLDEKTVRLIQLAAATAMRSEGSVVSHAKRAVAAGAAPAEVRHAILAVTSTTGVPTAAAALSWVEKLLED